MSYRRLISYCIFCLALNGPLSAQELARDLFDGRVLQDIRIDIDSADWSDLRQHYLEDTYYHVNVTWRGQVAYDAGIRSRGRGSRSPLKPNLDVNIDKYSKKQKLAGLTYFILKANNQDASLMHEALAFALYGKMGIPAPREAPARLYINGDYFGLYTVVERPDEDYLKRNLGESDGDFFEWKPSQDYRFQYLGDDPAPYAELLDPKTNEDTPDYGKFIDLVKAVNFASDAEFVAAISQYLDPRLYLSLVATENAIAEIDGLWDSVYGTNNIYLYRFANQDLFQFLPWDKDLTFWQTGRPLPSGNDNVLARRLMSIREYRDYYLAQLAKAADLMGGPGGWADSEVSRIDDLIRDTALNDPFKQCIQLGVALPPASCGPEAYTKGVRDLHQFLAVRSAMVNAWIAAQGIPERAPAPRIESAGVVSEDPTVASIQGEGFGEPADESLPSRSLDRSFVAIDGVRAEILSWTASEIKIQVPNDLPEGPAPVVVSSGGTLGNTAELYVSIASGP